MSRKSEAMEEDEPIYCICRSTDISRFMIGCEACEEWYHGDCIKVTEEEAQYIKHWYCKQCLVRFPSLEIKYHKKRVAVEQIDEPISKKSDHSNKQKSHSEHKKHDKPREKHESKQEKKSSKKCGSCKACRRTDDCGKCESCKDVKKFGGYNKLQHSQCRLKKCLDYTKSERKDKYEDRPSTKSAAHTEKISKKEADVIETPRNTTSDKSATKESESESRRDVSQQSKDRMQPQRPPNHQKPAVETPKKQSQYEGPYHPGISPLSGQQFYNFLGSGDTRQCFGPGCVQPARRNSKYCSDDCGLNLATNRIFEILPQRIQQWQSSKCVADEKNKEALEKIREKQRIASDKLIELDAKKRQLEALIQKGKKLSVLPDAENGENENEEAELSLFCVTCGLEVQQRIALRHMEKCFNKFESQTSFGSIYKTRIEGESMFCDFYSPSQRTYCKRLKVLCPEHTKEPKVPADEVCGYPLVTDVFKELGEFCRIPKRKCSKHTCWEKLRRAEIDMERLRQWMALDELFEQERQVRTSMASRAGVLALMLHQTIDHSQQDLPNQ